MERINFSKDWIGAGFAPPSKQAQLPRVARKPAVSAGCKVVLSPSTAKLLKFWSGQR
jgi:hypothetical protein